MLSPWTPEYERITATSRDRHERDVVSQTPGDLMATAFERSADPMVLFMPDGTVRAANRAARALGGGDPHRGPATFAELGIVQEDIVALRANYGGANEPRGEVRVRTPDGMQREFEYAGSADIEQGVHLAALREVTERRRVDHALRSSEELFARSFLAAPVALCVNNAATGAFTLVNEEFLQMSGYWRADVIGRTADDIHVWAVPADREQLLARLMMDGPAEAFRATFRHRTGRLFEALGRMRLAEIGGERIVVTAAFPA
jgi:PAS domain S-box-containing protein